MKESDSTGNAVNHSPSTRPEVDEREGEKACLAPVEQAWRWIGTGTPCPPVFVPESVQDCREWLSQRHQERSSVLVLGGGSHWFLGNIPSRVTHILSTRSLNRVLDYSPRDMTVEVQAGCPFITLQEALRSEGQHLPFRPLFGDRTTVGGIAALGSTGPAGPDLGRPRDFVIGIEVIQPEGIVSHAGGKVVKNVAGFDLCKLYCGSLGTLGLITRLTFKVKPRPGRSQSAILHPGAFEDLLQNALKLREVCFPARLTASCCGSAGGIENRRTWNLGVHFRDDERLLQWKLERLTRDWPEAEILGTEESRNILEEEDRSVESAIDPNRALTVLWISSPIELLSDVLKEALDTFTVKDVHAFPLEGSLLLTLESTDWIESLQSLRMRWADRFVYVVVLAAPLDLKSKVDCWGPSNQDLQVMRSLKERLDPHSVLNPGRYWGGI